MNLGTTRKLNNGVEIPVLGLGVFRSQQGQETLDAVRWALEAGYRHVDTAKAYGNEQSVGDGIRESGIDRKQLFITTKLWNEDMRQGTQREAFMKSLELLRTDYLDLYLIHWPVPGKYAESWETLIDLYNQKLIRAIGVSNFQKHHLDEIIRRTGFVPAVNQIEIHPRLTQVELCGYCEKLGIAPEAWSPLGHGTLLEDETLVGIAKKYGKSTAQIMIRWDLQRNIITIPKSVNRKRIAQNADVFDFELDDADMAAIFALNRNERTGPDPDNFGF
jgi:diketogulonate reductase-like aldo/keto reductase